MDIYGILQQIFQKKNSSMTENERNQIKNDIREIKGVTFLFSTF